MTDTYEDRQRLKKNADDIGKTQAEFVETVQKCIPVSYYDSATKIIYGYIEYQDGTWAKYPIPDDALERIAFICRYFGKIPLE